MSEDEEETQTLFEAEEQTPDKGKKNKRSNDQSRLSKLDVFFIIILLSIMLFTGFNLMGHFNNVKILSNSLNNEILKGLQNVHQNKSLTEEQYITKDNDSQISKKINIKLPVVKDEKEIQKIMPVYSNNIYSQNELQNGIRILFIKSNTQRIDFAITLKIGKRNDPFDKHGLTELLFRCLQTNFQIQIYDYYTTLTTELNIYEELNDKLQELYNILTKPSFVNIEKNANDLFNDLKLQQKSGDFNYVSEFLSQNFTLQDLKLLEVDSDQLIEQYNQYISADTISLIFKSQIQQKMILDQLFQSNLVQIKNLYKFQKADFDNKYDLGKNILKFKSETQQLAIFFMNDQFSFQKFLSYLLPKPFQEVKRQNHLLFNLEQDLKTVLNSTNKFMSFLDYLKQVDEIQLKNLYSYMQSREKLLLNTRQEENLFSIGQILFQNPDYVFKEQQYLPIFDKQEFDQFLQNLANNFIVLIGSKNFQYNKTHESQMDDSKFIMDDVLNKIHEDFIFDKKPLDQILNIDDKYEFQLPSISPFLPENLTKKISVCQEPINKISGQRVQKIDDLRKTVQVVKFKGSREPQFKEVKFFCEFPLPDFQVDCQQIEKAAQNSSTPFQITKNVWWKPSNLGFMVFKGLFIEQTMPPFLTQSRTMLKLLQNYYTELSKRLLQEEFELGYELSFKESINGLNIQMLGYSEKITEFENKVIDLMGYQDEQLFQQVKDFQIQDIKRFHEQNLFLLTSKFYLPYIMLRPIDTQQEILSVLNKINFKQFQEFRSSLLPNKFVILNIGNILPNYDSVKGSQKMYLTQTLNLNGLNLKYIVQRESKNDLNQSVLNYYQTGLTSIETTAKLYFYEDFLQSYAINYSQIGQQIQIKRQSLGCADGLLIYMQDVVPQKGQEEIENFLEKANSHLSKLQNQNIQEQKLHTINKLQNQITFNTLQEEGKYIWDKIVNKNYAFSEIQDVIKYLDEILPKNLKDCSNLTKQGQISVQVYANDQSIEKMKGTKSIEQLVNKKVYECFFTL